MIKSYRRSEIDPEAYITKNFQWKEWMCKCGKCEIQLLHDDIIQRLECLRYGMLKFPITINSGFRCKYHNAKVGGAVASRHMVGDGADISMVDDVPERIALVAEDVGFSGIKVYKSWVHVDLRPNYWKPNMPDRREWLMER